MFKINTVSRRLIVYIVLFSSLITILTTTIQLFFDYRRDLAVIEDHFEEIRVSHLTGLEASMWIMDVEQVRTMLEGVVQLRDLQYLSISDHGKLIAEAGDLETGKTLQKKFILQRNYAGQTIVLGTLQVVATLDGVYKRLIEKVMVILITNAVKTFSVACFFYWIFLRLVDRHLIHIADHARKLSPNRAGTQLKLTRRRPKEAPPDELDQVVEAINEMQENLMQSYQALARSEDLYSRAQKTANIGTWDWDISNNTLDWSEQIAPMFGLPDDDFENKYLEFIKLVHPEDRQKVEAAVSASIEEQAPYFIEHRIVWPDGTMRWVSEQGEVLFDDEGLAIRMIGVVQDITERKQAEEDIRDLNQSLEERVKERTMQLEEAYREMEAFAYSVSHDLRAPLRTITGFADILLMEAKELEPRLRSYLKKISDGGTLMDKLIDNLLDFSRLARKELAAQEVNLGIIVQQVGDELMAAQRDRIVDLQTAPLPPCFGDAALLKQVVFNLLQNAFKYTGHCERAIIDVGYIDDGTEVIYFVKDNGVGFDMRYADKLFGVFQRLHSVEEFEGTGIGLALVQRIIHRHGGRIWADAEKNHGATFYFTIACQA